MYPMLKTLRAADARRAAGSGGATDAHGLLLNAFQRIEVARGAGAKQPHDGEGACGAATTQRPLTKEGPIPNRGRAPSIAIHSSQDRLRTRPENSKSLSTSATSETQGHDHERGAGKITLG